MVPKKDAKGNVSIELTATEEKKLRAAWPVLEQLAYHTRGGCSRGTVLGTSIADAAKVVARLVDEEAKPEA